MRASLGHSSASYPLICVCTRVAWTLLSVAVTGASVTIDVRSFCFAVTLFVASFFSAESRAEPHARDGFYLQLASGLAAHRVWNTTENPFFEPAPVNEYPRSGAALNGSLLLGLPLRPGLALGAGGLLAVSPLNRPTQDGGRLALQIVGIVGPFVDFYPSRRLGWHVQALGGYASFSEGESNRSRSPKGSG